MSGKVVGWAMEQKTGSPTTKLVLVKLADNANEDGLCWPSLNLIVEHTELSARAVRDHLLKLEETGLIRVERREEEGVHLPNRYHLLVPWRKPAVVERPDKVSRGSAGGALPPTVVHYPSAGPAGGSAGGALGVVQDVPPYIEEPSIEPPREPKEEETPSLRSGDAAAVDPSSPSQPDLLTGEVVPFEPPVSEETKAFAAYDAAAARLGWAECQFQTEERRKKLKQRLKEAGGLPGWLAALERAEASPFLMGRAPPRPGHAPFRMHLDFLLQKSSFVKVMEGKYEQRGGGEESGFGAVLAGARASLAH